MLKKIGRYEILEELGQGAMGIVYKARDPRIGRVVALKTIHPGTVLSKDEQKEFYERFYREAQTAGNLSHPNIVTIFDADEDPEAEISFIAMEFIEGQSLQQLLDGDRIFTPEETLKIVLQIAEGLGYAHKNGIIHRDIKPANVILTPDNRAKITDFGIARIESSSLTRTGQFLGTPYYMAPEQIAGGQIDGRSDLFSLAVVFYQLLTREKPFSGNNITTILYKIVNQEPLPATRINMGLADGFDMMLTRGLAKKPEDRYQDADQFVADLRSLLGGEIPVHAGAEATMVVPRTTEPAATIDSSRLAPPAAQADQGGSTAATSAAAGEAAPAAKPKTRSHATLIGFAAALTVVVVFLIGFLVLKQRGGDTPAGGQPARQHEQQQEPEFLMAQIDQPAETAAGSPATAAPGEVAEIIEPPVEKTTTAAARQAPEKVETAPAEPAASMQVVSPPAETRREATPPAGTTTPPREQPPVKTTPPPATTVREPPPTRPREVDPGRTATSGTADPAEADPATRPVEEPVEETAPPTPPQEYGYLDIAFTHSFKAGRLTIRTDGTEVYSERFSGTEDKGGWKGVLNKAKALAKGTEFTDYGIQVPVGRYPIEVKVTVPGKDLNPVTVNARFRPDQERCLSIGTKRLINRDEIQARWGCESDDDDDDDEEDDDEDDDDKKKDDDD